MASSYIKLYSLNDDPDTGYLLNEGSVYFFVSEMDKYVIKGKNLIVGATEIIMNRMADAAVRRMETAVTDRESVVKKLPVEKFLAGMNSYSFALNVSMVIAKQVALTNSIINKSMNTLTGDLNKNREASIEYFILVDRLKGEYAKRKIPWLSELISRYETSLIFKRGEAFYRSSEPTRITTTTNLSDKMVEYPTGSVICAEDTSGEEMFILESGSIEVKIRDNRVATIEEKGTFFGEMALLLGEKRAATLIAKNNVVVTKITKENLKEISEQQGDFLKILTVSLAKKHYYNIIKIEGINQTLIEKSVDEGEAKSGKVPESLKTRGELQKLKHDIGEMARLKKADFMDTILKES